MEQLISLENDLLDLKNQLKKHEIYNHIKTIDDIKNFMRYHVFAVWDFMSLLKSLQNDLTCTSIPWIPSENSKVARLINEIVLIEESDIYNEITQSHYQMYIAAMKDIGAICLDIQILITAIKNNVSIFTYLNKSNLDSRIKNYLRNTFDIINTNETHLKLAAFTYGREDIIPTMFLEIVKQLKIKEDKKLDKFISYLERHIEVDGDDHSPMCKEMLIEICGDDNIKWKEIRLVAKKCLQQRIYLWDAILDKINSVKLMNPSVKTAT